MSKNIIFNTTWPTDVIVSTEYNPEATKYNQGLATAEYRKIHDDPLIMPYLMNEQETEIMKEILGTRYAVYKNKPSPNGHALAANLTAFGYQRCKGFGNKHFKRCMDMGGSPLRTPESWHCCCKISTSREEARYIVANAILPTPAFSNLHNHMRNTSCIHGAEKCGYPADYASMINVYDVSLNTIVEIFDSHNLKIMDCWMFLPYILFDKNNTIDQTYYKCEIKNNRDKWPNLSSIRKSVVMHFDDSSNVYEHDYNIWQSYLTTTVIRGRTGGAIVMEHIETFGTFTCIRFTRTWLDSGTIERCIPVSKYMSPYMMVPSVTEFIKHGVWRSTRSRITNVDKTTGTRQNQPYIGSDMEYVEQHINNLHNGNIYEHYYIVEKDLIKRIVIMVIH